MTRNQTTTMKTNHYYYLGALAALVALVTSILALVVAHPAQAAFPGANGKIVFASGRDGNLEIYKMNPDGTRQRNLTKNQADDYEPAVSPDGKKIAFTTSRDGNFNLEVYSMDASGANPTNLTKNAALDLDPVYSPNGMKIAFRSDRRGNNEVHVMNAVDGSSQKRLTTNSATDMDPDWGVRTP